MQTGTKTRTPVSKEEALKIWEKLIHEKKAKGYHEGEAAPAYTEEDGTTKDTGLRAMLLTPASEDDALRFLSDPQWGAQEKLNGKRIMIRSTQGTVVGANRRGLACSIPQAVASALARVDAVLDGEMMGARFFAFDLLEDQMVDLRREDYAFRHSKLVERFGPSVFPEIQIVPLALRQTEKRALFEALKAKNAEGIVFKMLGGIGYSAGKVENLNQAHAVKVKFYASAECIVTGWNSGRQSISLGAYDERGVLIPIGNVTVPKKYVHQIEVECVVQVRYLFATLGHQLYQPTLDPSSGSIRRDDKKPAECLLAQLKYEGQD
jgi:bifunctional non-homologous end joining protein LigD